NLPASALIVAQDGSGAFTSIQAALDSIVKPNLKEVVIYIKAGNYSGQQVNVTADYVTLVGDGLNKTIISNMYYNALYTNVTGSSNGASAECATVRVNGNYFKAFDLTFENTAPTLSSGGQAPAFYMNGNNLYVENCAFLSLQDTLLVYSGTNQWYKNCYIRGETDFIWGYGRAIFEDSEYHVDNIKFTVRGSKSAYIVANGGDFASRANSDFWLFNSTITVDPGIAAYLGRVWGQRSAAIYDAVYMPDSVPAAGWTYMSSAINYTSDAQYREVTTTNYGPGA
ncbi:pectin lyase fold/virulence factor, partial [Zopfochytrium polystomum]